MSSTRNSVGAGPGRARPGERARPYSLLPVRPSARYSRRTRTITRWATSLVAVVIMLAALGTGSVPAEASSSQPGTAVKAPGCPPQQLQGAGVPPIGAPVATISGDSGSVTIAGKDYTPSGPGSLAHLVIVNRCSLAVQAFAFGDGGDSLVAIENHLANLDAGSMVILAMPDGLSLSYSQVPVLNDDVLAKIGAQPLTIDHAENAFSVIGARDWQPDTAFRNMGGTFGDVAGNMSGYLRLNPVTERYDFVFSEYVPFDTVAAASGSLLVRQVGRRRSRGSTRGVGDQGLVELRGDRDVLRHQGHEGLSGRRQDV